MHPIHTRSNGLDFLDNPMFDHGVYIEIDKELNVTLKFKGENTYSHLKSLSFPELDTCPHFHMTNVSEWNPDTVDLRKIWQISKAGTTSRKVFKVNRDTVYTLTNNISTNVHDTFA